MLAKIGGGILAIVLAVTVAQPLQAVAQPLKAEVTAAAVDESIKAGVQYLLSRQDKASGAWAEYKGEPGGLTALITLALLNCGVPKEHEQIKKALDYLEKIELPQQN
jgi:hypothetical protein